MKKYLPAPTIPLYLLERLPEDVRAALLRSLRESTLVPQDVISRGIGPEPNPNRRSTDIGPE